MPLRIPWFWGTKGTTYGQYFDHHQFQESWQMPREGGRHLGLRDAVSCGQTHAAVSSWAEIWIQGCGSLYLTVARLQSFRRFEISNVLKGIGLSPYHTGYFYCQLEEIASLSVQGPTEISLSNSQHTCDLLTKESQLGPRHYVLLSACGLLTPLPHVSPDMKPEGYKTGKQPCRRTTYSAKLYQWLRCLMCIAHGMSQ